MAGDEAMNLAQRHIRQLRMAERLVREGIIKVPPSPLEFAKASLQRAIAESMRRDPCGLCRTIREKERPRVEPIRALVPDLYDLYLRNGRLINCSPGGHDESACAWRP